MSIFEETRQGPVAHLRSTLGGSEVAARVGRWALRLPYLASFAYLWFFEGHYTTLGVVLSVLGLVVPPVLARVAGIPNGFWDDLGTGGDDGDSDGGCGGGCGGGD